MSKEPLRYLVKWIPIVTLIMIIIISFNFEKYNVAVTNMELDKTLVINEVLADNVGGLSDEEGDYTDWIEIYNFGQAEINLEGYGISDDLEEPFKWTFPNITIQPQGFIVVRASGKDRKEDIEYLHSNFSIDKKGETIVLTHCHGETLDCIKILSTEQNIPFGRKPDGQDKYAILSKVTPGEPNYVNILENVIQEERLETPKFSREAGFYEEEFELEITTEDDEITIYYTLDGSEPTINSKVYSKPIKIKSREGESNKLANIKTSEVENSLTLEVGAQEVYKGTVIRTRAFKEGVFSDEVTTNSYFINPSYTLPIISIVTNKDNLFGYDEGIYVPGRVYDLGKKINQENIRLGDIPRNYNQKGEEWEREASIEYFSPEGIRVMSLDAGIRVFGGWSRMENCKSIKIYAREKYGEKSIDFNIFNNNAINYNTGESINSFKRLILRNSGNDFNVTMFKDAFMQSLVKDISIDTQAYKPVIMFINGEYWGIHNIRESYDEYYIESHYNIDTKEVIMLEADPKTSSMVTSIGSIADAEEFNGLMKLIVENDMSLKCNYDYINEKVDIDNFIKYTICELYFGNADWKTNNIKVWRSKGTDNLQHNKFEDGRWRWLLFDLDFAFNSYNFNIYEDEGSINRQWSLIPIENLLANDEFRSRFLETFYYYLDTIFEPSHVVKQIEEMAAVIEPEIDEHLDRWSLQSNYLGRILHKIKGVEPYRTDWESEVNKLIEFAEKRPDYMRQFLDEYIK